MENSDFNFNSLFNIGDSLKQIQEKLSKYEAIGESGGGDVKVTINGKREILKIEFNKNMLNPENKQMLEDLTLGAINKAMKNISEKIKNEVMPDNLMNLINNQ